MKLHNQDVFDDERTLLRSAAQWDTCASNDPASMDEQSEWQVHDDKVKHSLETVSLNLVYLTSDAELR